MFESRTQKYTTKMFDDGFQGPMLGQQKCPVFEPYAVWLLLTVKSCRLYHSYKSPHMRRKFPLFNVYYFLKIPLTTPPPPPRLKNIFQMHMLCPIPFVSFFPFFNLKILEWVANESKCESHRQVKRIFLRRIISCIVIITL